MEVATLIWDDWNRTHLKRHLISEIEVDEVCKGRNKVRKGNRGRILLAGRTKSGRVLKVVLSQEDRLGRNYGEGVYYAITAYDKEEK